ncbi:hypothetical protein CSKR_109968 [Clonorchis sinensis]|uniref:Uncharacterized protein n=1 Tax=Clonorchis sinensis TaxID=79923 RepID=A0A419PZF3_CLOSI|nr:hypothetical protein CSKR_109968 [Clonorchis sinensis]
MSPKKGETGRGLSESFQQLPFKKLSLEKPVKTLGQPGRILALVLPSGGMAARHRKGVTAEQFFYMWAALVASFIICILQPDDSTDTIFEKSKHFPSHKTTQKAKNQCFTILSMVPTKR